MQRPCRSRANISDLPDPGMRSLYRLFVAGLAVTTKRLHDRNKGAIWLLVFIVIPLVINVYVFATMIASGPGLDPQQMAAPRARTRYLLIGRLVAGVLSIWGFVELYCLARTVGRQPIRPRSAGGAGLADTSIRNSRALTLRGRARFRLKERCARFPCTDTRPQASQPGSRSGPRRPASRSSTSESRP